MKKKQNETSTRKETFREGNNALEMGLYWASEAFKSAREAHHKEAAGTLEPLDPEEDGWEGPHGFHMPPNTSAEHLKECIEKLEEALKAARLGFTDGPWGCTRLEQHRHWEDGSIYHTECGAPARKITAEDGSTGWECEKGCRHWEYGSQQGKRQMLEDERRWKEDGLGY